MTITGEDGRRECRGYASFALERQRPDFSRWFEQLEADIRLLAREPHQHLERPVLLQHALVDAVELLEPKCARFAAERRTRLDAPGA